MLLAMFELKFARLMMRKHSSIFVGLLLLIRIPYEKCLVTRLHIETTFRCSLK